jgi:DNA modification methylase
MRVRQVPIDDVKPYPNNPRKEHDVRGIVAAVQLAGGWRVPIVAWEGDGCILAGHGRLLAAREMGMAKVPVHFVGRSEITEEQARAWRIADNRVGERSGWDDRQLLAELELLDEARRREAGFDEDDEAELRRRIEQEDLAEADREGEDDAPEPPEQPATRTGDLWVLGDHRLLCGDATSVDDVASLGPHGHLMVTDPPYGVNYEPAWRDAALPQMWGSTRSIGRVRDDDRADWREAWVLFDGDAAYVWSGDRHLVESGSSLIIVGFELRGQIVWRKQHFAVGRGNYHAQHESCWYAVRKGCKSHWTGDRTQSTVWDVANAFSAGHSNVDDGKTNHSTQKPVEVMRRPMVNNSVKGDLVYDPFVGSGTSIIAAESVGRRCRAIDVDPAYCDVAVDRWQRFTGKRATLEATGEAFDDLRARRLAEAAA